MSAEESALTISRDPEVPGMRGVVYRFFDDNTGHRTGQVRIGTVGLEYRHQGVMRVAWKPQVVLADVEMDFGADLAWPEHGAQIVEHLQSLAGRDVVLMRNVRLRLGGKPNREIVAPTARFMPGGVIELTDATMTENGGAPGRRSALRLVLAGPDAGRLMQPASTSTRPTPEILSASNTPSRFSP